MNVQIASISRHSVDRAGHMHKHGRAYMIVADDTREYLLEASAPWRLNYASWLAKNRFGVGDMLAFIVEPKVRLIATSGTRPFIDDFKLNQRADASAAEMHKDRFKRGFFKFVDGMTKVAIGGALGGIGAMAVAGFPPVMAAGVAVMAAAEYICGKNLVSHWTADLLGDSEWIRGTMLGGAEIHRTRGKVRLPDDIAAAARLQLAMDAPAPEASQERAAGWSAKPATAGPMKTAICETARKLEEISRFKSMLQPAVAESKAMADAALQPVMDAEPVRLVPRM